MDDASEKPRLARLLVEKYVEIRKLPPSQENLLNIAALERAIIDNTFLARTNAGAVDLVFFNLEADIQRSVAAIEKAKYEMGPVPYILPDERGMDEKPFDLLARQFDAAGQIHRIGCFNPEMPGLTPEDISALRLLNARIRMQIEEEMGGLIYDFWAPFHNAANRHFFQKLPNFGYFRHICWQRMNVEFSRKDESGTKGLPIRKSQLNARQGAMSAEGEPFGAGDGKNHDRSAYSITVLRTSLAKRYEEILENPALAGDPAILSRIELALTDLAFIYNVNASESIQLAQGDVERDLEGTLNAIALERVRFGVKHYILPETTNKDEINLLNEQLHKTRKILENGFVQSDHSVLGAVDRRIQGEALNGACRIMWDCWSTTRDPGLKHWYTQNMQNFGWLHGQATTRLKTWYSDEKTIKHGVAAHPTRASQVGSRYNIFQQVAKAPMGASPS